MTEPSYVISVFKHNRKYEIFLAGDEEATSRLHQIFRVIYENPISGDKHIAVYKKLTGIIKRANLECLKQNELLEEMLSFA